MVVGGMAFSYLKERMAPEFFAIRVKNFPFCAVGTGDAKYLFVGNLAEESEHAGEGFRIFVAARCACVRVPVTRKTVLLVVLLVAPLRICRPEKDVAKKQAVAECILARDFAISGCIEGTQYFCLQKHIAAIAFCRVRPELNVGHGGERLSMR